MVYAPLLVMSLDPVLPIQTSNEGRAAPRSSMYLAAVMSDGRPPLDVRIRNMSRTGALVEGLGLPPVASTVRLSRGSLAIAGRIVWSNENRCGVQFNHDVEVDKWLSPALNRKRQRVDSIIRQVKQNSLPKSLPQLSAGISDPTWLTEDLERIGYLLEKIGDRLADDEDVISRHQTHVQQLDIAIQSLKAIADSVSAQGLAGATSGDRVNHLRKSAAEALNALAMS